jgi:predicted Rossmann fold flavoprotein
MNENTFDVIVVGGGASGMMAAGRCAQLGKKVLLIEKNKDLGEKLKITGGGRCNITNNTPDVRKFLENFGDASVYLFSTFSQFAVKETYDFFEKLNLAIKVEENNRAFPESENAHDVVKAMKLFLKNNNVEIKKGEGVKKFNIENEEIKNVIVGGKEYSAKNYILATGGLSHPETGSTGDGFNWLKDFGHTVKPPTPTLVPIKTSSKWSHKISGVSLSDAKIDFYIEDKKESSVSGKLLFTHFGLSGPVILNSAALISDYLHAGEVVIKIDLFPDKNIGELGKYLVDNFDENKNKDVKNVLKSIVPEGMISGILVLLNNIDVDKKVHSITKDERRYIVDILKALPIKVTSLMGDDKSVVSDGGVVLKEIDTRTMKSKMCKNLFVTGDLLHINRPTGGYSLQLCWTTGWVAGSNA